MFVNVVPGGASTVTETVTCLDCPTLRFPRAQNRAPSSEHEGELENRVTPPGRASWITTPLAFEGPRLWWPWPDPVPR